MKKCPFCAEEIQNEAVFCRFCSKNLTAATEAGDELIYEGKASFKGHATFLFFSVLLIPLFGVGLVMLLYLYIKIKTENYKITVHYLEKEEGLIVRRHSTLDNWRIKDIKFTCGPVEALFKSGTITVASIDKSSPLIKIAGLPGAKTIYQKLKDAAFKQRAERKVTGLELSA